MTEVSEFGTSTPNRKLKDFSSSFNPIQREKLLNPKRKSSQTVSEEDLYVSVNNNGSLLAAKMEP